MNKDYINKDYMKNTFDNVMNKVKTMIVDGAMATELEAMGCDIPCGTAGAYQEGAFKLF